MLSGFSNVNSDLCVKEIYGSFLKVNECLRRCPRRARTTERRARTAPSSTRPPAPPDQHSERQFAGQPAGLPAAQQQCPQVRVSTLVPNRIFVGGISANTTESELMQLFSSYGTVKAAKIIQDRAGVSKGYGFITFESEDDAKRPLREAENIVLRERKLNIAPAIKKQPFSRAFDASSPPAVAAGNPAQFFFPPGTAMPYFQGGVAYYPQPPQAALGDPAAQQPVYQPPPVYPADRPPQTATYPSMMFPAQTIYMPRAVPHAHAGDFVDFLYGARYVGLYDYNYYQGNGAPPAAQYMVGSQGRPRGPQCPPLPPSSSPPRPPCYGQQVPAYNSADPVFYNLPMYGAAMEGPPVYAEAFDLAANGPYGELRPYVRPPALRLLSIYSVATAHRTSHIAQDTYVNVADHLVTPQDLETAPFVNAHDIDHHRHHHHHPPPPHFVTTDKPPINNNTTTITNQPHHLEDSRNSNTPVVSLLSIDQQQEKDYLSMQGGRRRKSNPSSAPQNLAAYPSNGYVNSYALGYPAPPYAPYNQYQDCRRANGASRVKRKTYDRRQDHSSRSSLRTDSNSSASYVDENKNETRTGVHMGPPPVQGFAPAARRSRRNIRRGGATGVNEIGAGDAPLPNDDVCKKFETLKL
ncbi:hypothetical protein NQ317_002103 [Molorchus minor]|uniref:RRM domain-containing protein n=1 Tax=Molorchus minor TaxID=1323400 RepID=A0ABQ9JW57_9CUCU|nr:hypothetical protein NQ317_002103 [Molorchus minor]